MLKRYEVSFQKNNLHFPDSKQIFHVTPSYGNLLQALKVYYAVEDKQILFVKPNDDIDAQKLILDAFALPQYVFLIINQHKVIEESVLIEMCAKLRHILKKKYKKIILMTGNNAVFYRYMGAMDTHCKIMDVPVMFQEFSNDFQENLLTRKSIIFQGQSVSLEELLVGRITEHYMNAVDQEILENIIKGEKVEVGVQPLDMDKNIAPFYINRTFKRSVENIYEEDIYDVKEDVVLISDNVGVGKTTVLSKLAMNIKERNPHLWVIKVALTEYTHLLKNLKDSGEAITVVKLLNSENTRKVFNNNNLESFVFSMEKNVVLMLDGIDEISPDYTELALDLLMQCVQAPNFAKLFVTTRPHMMRELKEILEVDPFELQAFTEHNQVDFLVGYWTHKLDITHNKEKCEKFARALIERMSSWTKEWHYGKDKFTGITLQLKMLAEIFQEATKLNESSDWEGCKEYLESARTDPKLQKKIEVKELYDLFIERKRNIYIQKANASGNCETNTALDSQFNNYLTYHKKLALELILSEEHCRLFSCYRKSSEVTNESIMQGTNEELYFTHRSFAEYFVAESLVNELQLQSQHSNVKFQQFFIEDFLATTDYETVRIFLDSFLQNVIDSVPSNSFESYQAQRTNSNFAFYDYLINLLAKEGCIAILQLVLKCIDFENVKDEINFTEDLHQQLRKQENLFQTFQTKNMIVNTLSFLKCVLPDMGLEVRNVEGRTPLMSAIEGGHLKMVRFLVGRGARLNSADRYGFTALHLAVDIGHMDILDHLLEQKPEIDCRNSNGYTPLHVAAVRTDLECFKYLVRSGANVTIRDNRGRTVLHFAAVGGQFGPISFLLKLDGDRSNKSSMYLSDGKERQTIIESLVKSLGDINIKDNDECTPLHFAARYNHLDTVKLLHDLGGDLTIGNNRGKTPLHLAAEEGHSEIVRALHQLDAPLNIKDNDGRTPLHSAAASGFLDVVIHLHENRTDLNTTDIHGKTPLHLAAEEGHSGIVRALSQLGAHLNITDNDGRTPLHLAAASKFLDIVKYLHRDGADLNNVDNCGRTALHSAAASGFLDVIEYLHESRADISITDHRGRTPLHLAAEYGDLNSVKCLVKFNKGLDVKDNDGCTPLFLAAVENYIDIVKFLHQWNASFSVKDNRGKSVLHILIENGSIDEYFIKCVADINAKDNNGSTALHLAAEKGRMDAVNSLCKMGAHLNIRDHHGRTALHLAAASGRLDVVECLHKKGAALSITDNRGKMHLAAEYGHLDGDLVKFIDINIRDNDGCTPLLLAASRGHMDVVKFLVQQNANCNVKDSSGKTVLHVLVENGCVNEDFIKCVADINAKDNNGSTALQLAAEKGRMDAVNSLCEMGADLNIRDNHGRTPLHLAAASGCLDVVECLREKCADLTIKDKDGCTPKQLADVHGNLEIVNYIKI